MEDDTTKPIYELIGGLYEQKKADDKWVYTYTGKDADGNEATIEYYSEYQNLASFAVDSGEDDADGKDIYTKYTLKPVYTETKIAGAWSWGFVESNNFYQKMNHFIECAWEILGVLEPLLQALFFGKDSNEAFKLFDTLNIEGQNGYEDMFLPLLRAFGIDNIFGSLATTEMPGHDGKTYLQVLNEERKATYGNNVTDIPDRLIRPEGMKATIASDPEGDGTYHYDMKEFFKVGMNYIVFFIEVLASYPITTLLNALPTLAYNVAGDGLNEIISNILTFLTVLTDRLAPIVKIDVNSIGGGLIDYLGTDDWQSFQEAFTGHITVNADGTVTEKEVNVSLTQALISFVANIKFDLGPLLKKEGEYTRTLTYFIDPKAEEDAWALINANPGDSAKLEEARTLRADAVEAWLEELAGLADPFGASYTDSMGTTHNIPDEFQNYVKIDAVNGQVNVSKADVFMFVLDFIFENTTIKEVLGSLLGYDITDENGANAEMLDELLTNIFKSPDAVVDLIIALFTTYTVAPGRAPELIEIEEYHYDFYDDNGLTYADILAQGDAYTGSEISRAKTSYAIDNLDKLVGTVLNLFKADLVKEGGLFNGIFTEEDDINLKDAVNGLLEDMLFSDDMINDLLGMLVGLLAGDDLSQIIGILTDILGSAADIDISVANFADNNAILTELFKDEDGKAMTWSEIAKANTKYEYTYKKLDAEGNVLKDKDGKEVTASYFGAKNLTEATVDADGDGAEDDTVALTPVYNKKQATVTKGEGEDAITMYEYFYYASEEDETNDIRTTYYADKQNETTHTIPGAEGEEGTSVTLTAVMIDDITSQKTAVKFDAQWNIVETVADTATEAEKDAARKASRNKFVTVLWDVLEPLSPVLEVFLTGKNITIYEEINIRGFDGYENVLKLIIEGLGVPVLERADGTKYLDTFYATQEAYELAVYGGTYTDDLGIDVAVTGESQILLQVLLDAVFALVDSLCDRPISTLATILPYLSRFLESDGLDIIVANLLAPVTAITDMIKDVYDLDIMGLIKGLLQGLAAELGDPAVDTATAYAEQKIDEAKQANANAGIALAADDPLDSDSGIDTSKLTFMDIIWNILKAVKIDLGDGKKLALNTIITDRLFVTLASCAWYNDENASDENGRYVSIKDVEYDYSNLNNSSVINDVKYTDYYVDRETVLLAVLDTLLFQDSVRDLIGGLVGNMKFDDETLQNIKNDDNDALLTRLIYGVFQDGEALERLLIDLLSWYDIEYAPERVDVSDLSATLPEFNEETTGLNEAELEKLPEQLDGLVAAILPLLGELLPTFGVDLELDLTGDTLEEMVQNLITSLFKDTLNEDGSVKGGLGTTLFALLVNLLGANKLDSILTLVKELTGGVDLTLKYFKDSSEGVKAVFADYDTWEEAYEGFKTKVKFDSEKDKYLVAGGDTADDTTDDEYEPKANDGTYLYKVADKTNDPIAVLAKDKDGNSIPVYADAQTLTDDYGTYYITSGTAAEGEEPIKDAYVVETKDGKVVYEYQWQVTLTNTNSFGVKTYDDALKLLTGIITPLIPVLKLVLFENGDLVILDGVTISAGDGYDRFIIPLVEMLGITVTKDKYAAMALTDAELAKFLVDGIAKIVHKLVQAPVQTIVDLLPQLAFFVESNGLAQAVEQLLAPVITLVDMVNDVTAAEHTIPGRTEPLIALDIYGMLFDLLKNELGLNIEGDTVEALISGLLTAEGLENLIMSLVKDEATGETKLPFLEGFFADLVSRTCAITDVKTMRYFGAIGGDQRTVKGVKATRANTLVQLISEMVLAENGLIFDILDLAKADWATDETIKTVIEGITGENRYCILEVLLNYFNHYDVEGSIIDYLSFDAKTYDYETYAVDTTLTARKVRRAIKKLDKAILALIPDILPMLEEVDLLKGTCDAIKAKNNGSYDGVTLADVVEALLTDLAFNDETMDMLIGTIVGLLGGDAAGTITDLAPVLSELLDVNLQPEAVAAGAGEGSALYNFIITAYNATEADRTTVSDDELATPTIRDFTWADLANYYSDYRYYYIVETVVEDDPATEENEAKTVYTVAEYFDNEIIADGTGKTIKVDGADKLVTLYNRAIVTDNDGNVIWTNKEAKAPKFSDVTKTEKIEGVDVVKYAFDWTYTDAEDKKYSGREWLTTETASTATVEINGVDTEVTLTKAWNMAGTKVLGIAGQVDWGIDSAKATTDKSEFEAKKDAFIDVLYGVVKAVEPVVNFLFHGDSIAIKSTDSDGKEITAIELKGGEGYKYAIYPLLQALAADQMGNTLVSASAYADGKNTELTLTAIIDGVFNVVENLEKGPVEFILNLLPSLSYFLKSDGLRLFVENLLSPVFALLDVAEPAVGALLDDLLGGLLSPMIGKFMPADLGKEEVNDKGETVTMYTLDEILQIAGPNGSNLVKILNELLGGLLVKTPEGETAPVIEILPATFFADYVAYAVEIDEANVNSKWFYDVKITEAGAAAGYGKVDQIITIPQADYTEENKAYYTVVGETRYAVNNWTVDIADSFVYLLDCVLSGDLLDALVDEETKNKEDLIGTIINNIINGKNLGLTITDILVSLFEGYSISYAPINGIYIPVDHEDMTSAENLPAKLDTIINEALPVILPLIAGDEATGILKTLVDALDGYKSTENGPTAISELLDALLDEFLGDQLVNDLLGMLIGILGNDTIDMVLGLIKIGDHNLTAPEFKAQIDAHFAGKADYAVAVAAIDAIIGNAESWAEVAKALIKYEYTYVITPATADAKEVTGKYYGDTADLTKATIDGTEYALTKSLDKDNKHITAVKVNATWGVDTAADKLTALIDVFTVVLEPLTEVLQLILQGKTLTLLSSNGTYKGDFDTAIEGAKDNDDRAEEVAEGILIGDGYIEIRGSKGYDEGLLALAEAVFATKDGYAIEIVDGETFNGYTKIEDILSAVVDIVMGLVNGLKAAPITFLADHLAGLLYFVASDNLTKMVDNVLALVDGLGKVLEPLTGNADLLAALGLDLGILQLDKLLDMLNDLIHADKFFEVTVADGKYTYNNGEKTVELTAEQIAAIKKDHEFTREDKTTYKADAIEIRTGLDLTITKAMLNDLVAALGEYTTIEPLRSTFEAGLLKEDGSFVDANGNAISAEADITKITTIVGCREHFADGLLSFALSDEIIGKLLTVDESDPDNILNDIIPALTKDGAADGVIELLNKLSTKYLVEYVALLQSDFSLEKLAILYKGTATAGNEANERDITKAEAEHAIANINGLIGPILEIAGLGNIEDLIGGLVFTDDIVNSLAGLLANLFGGLDSKIMDIIDTVAGILGEEIDLSVETYKKDADIAGFFGEATTWAEVIEMYTKNVYTYTIPADPEDSESKPETVEVYLDAGKTEITVDGKTYPLTAIMTQKTDKDGTPVYLVNGVETALKAEAIKKAEDGTITTTVNGEDVVITVVYSDKQATKVAPDYKWGMADLKTLDDKADKLVDILTSFLAPLDFILEVLLAGGTNDGNAANADSIGAFKEINIMGGSGYNYAIIPLLETLGVPNSMIKTQAEYEATLATEGALGYVLDTLLDYIIDGLDKPLDLVAGLLGNLLYTVNGNGLTTIISNLIAPVSELLVAVQDTLPVAIKIDLSKVMVKDAEIFKIMLGDDVAANGAEVGLDLNLDKVVIEDLLFGDNGVLASLAPDLVLDLRIADFVAAAVKTDENGIVLTDSKVDTTYDICKVPAGDTWRKRIEIDTADALINLLDQVLTTETINSLLTMLKVDLDTLLKDLPATLKTVVDDAIDNPTALIDAIVKLLAAGYDVDLYMVLYDVIDALTYNYKAEGINKSTVELVLNKLDAVINNAIGPVLDILVGMDNMPALVLDLATAVKEGEAEANIGGLLEYFLNDLLFKDDTLDKLWSLLIGVLGSMDDKTFNMINDILGEVLDVQIDPVSFASAIAAAGIDESKIAAFISAVPAPEEGELTWAYIASQYEQYVYTYTIPADTTTDPEAKDEVVEITSLDADLAGTMYELEDGTKYELSAKYVVKDNVATDEREMKVVATFPWGVDAAADADKQSTFINVVLEILAPFGVVLDWLFRGEDITLIIDGLKLKGGNAYDNVLVPLAKALGADLKTNAELGGNKENAIVCVEELLNGILGLVDKLADKPLNTIVELVSGLAYFVASDGVAEAINGIAAPILGLLTALEGILPKSSINALIKDLTKKFTLSDIIHIAGEDGSGLVELLNELIGSVEITDKVTGESVMLNLLPATFFLDLAKYGINVEATADVPSELANTQTKHVTEWSVDKVDALMYVLSTVCSEDFLRVLCNILKQSEDSTLGEILVGLAGKQENIVDILVTLLTDYEITYSDYNRPAINKTPVTHIAPMTEENLQKALAALDPIIVAVIGLVGLDVDSLQSLLGELLEGIDLGNTLMNLLVPLLAGLENNPDVDLDAILGYVKDLTNLDLDISPRAFAHGKFGSKLADFILGADVNGDGTITWTEVNEKYATSYEYTYNDGKDKIYSTDSTLTVYDHDADPKTEAVALTKTLNEDGTDKMFIKYDWTLGMTGENATFDGLVDLVSDLLFPLDAVLGLLLTGDQIIVLEDTNADGSRGDDIRLTGGRGYNFAIIPLLEAFGIEAMSEAEYKSEVAQRGHIHYILDALITKIEDELLKKPVETLFSMLANIFYFIGTDGINSIAENLLVFANVLLEKVAPVFKIGVAIDLAELSKTDGKVLKTTFDKNKDGTVPTYVDELEAGVKVNVKASDLTAMLSDLLGGIELDINGEKTPLGLSLDLDFLAIASQMAATDENGIIKVPTAQIKTDGTAATWYNIKGDPEDTFTTLIKTILTPDNTFAIAKLIESLLADANLPDGTPDENGKETIDVVGIINDVIYDPNGIQELLAAVVLLLSGSYTIENFTTVYKFLGALTYFAGEDAANGTKLNSALSKLDAIITREVPEILPMFIDATTATGILKTLVDACDGSADLGDMINKLLTELAFTAENYDKLMGILVKALAGFLTADLAGTIGDLLGIDLAPKAFAEATGNDALIAYVGESATWADVWAAHSEKNDKDELVAKPYADITTDADGKETVNYKWNVTDQETFVEALLSLLTPLNPVLDFIFCNGELKLLDEAIALPGGDAYNKALIPLFKALGVELGAATTTTEALDALVDGLIGANGLVGKIGEAPLQTVLKLVAGLSYLLANDNLEPIIRNLLAPVFSILKLLEPVISTEQLDGILEGLIGMSLTEIIEIGNNGGANLVGLINDLLGGFEVKDKDGNVIDTVDALESNFFVELSKYAIDVTDPATGLVANVTVANAWNVDAAETLMFILDKVLDDTFLKVLVQKIAPDAKEDDAVVSILTSLANKEMALVDVILMLLENYTITYNRYQQVELDKNIVADYSAFDTNEEKVKEALPDAIVALDALLGSVLGLIPGMEGGDIKGMIEGLVADADLGNLLMNLLVPVLAGLDLDEIIGYVNNLTNLSLDINPQAFAAGKFGSELKNFIGDAKTWAEVSAKYQQYVYEYETTDAEGNAVKVEYTSKNKNEATIDITTKDADGKDVVTTYNLTKVMKDVVTKNEDGTETTTKEHTTKFVSDFNWNIKTLDDLVNFACDLLLPLDVVFEVLLSGKQIIALEDGDTVRRADIRINGGYGYNYAIIPLLEVLGIKAVSQSAYDAQIDDKYQGSSLKYILDALIGRVDEILKKPVQEVLGLFANLCYFIGSEGINTLASNLVAPVNELLYAVSEVYPIGIVIDVTSDKIIKTTFDKNTDGSIPDYVAELDGGLLVNVTAAGLNNLLGGLLSGIEVNGAPLGLTLDLNWNKLAAAMAKRDADGNIIYTGSALEYGVKGTVTATQTPAEYKNISGEPSDALVSLLNAILTDENVAAIKSLVIGLLGETELDPTIEGLLNDVLSDRGAIINLLGTVILVLTGEYDINTLSMVFKFLGAVDHNVANADTAIATLDRLIAKALPVVLDMLADTSKPEAEWGILEEIAASGETTLDGIVEWALNDLLFTDDMMGTITDALVGALAGFLNEGLAGTLGDLLGIDLAPVAFAQASKNQALIDYVTIGVTGTGTDGLITWADVLAAHKHEVGIDETTGEPIYEIDNIFTGVSNKDAFLNAFYSMLTPLESVLAFLLTGGNLEIAKGLGVDNVMLKGNAGYDNAIWYLFKALGLEEMGATWKPLAEGDDAIDALSNTVDYVFALVDTLCDAPFDTILVLLGNLSFFIANGGVEVLINNLVSPILSLVDALEGTISRAQLDALLASLTKNDMLTISGILGIAGEKGEKLVELINGFIPGTEIKDAEGNVIHVLKALPDDFFVQLAKAAIQIDTPAGLKDPADIGKEVTTWHVDTGDTLMYILATVLSEDMLNAICNAIGESLSADIRDIITGLAGKEEELLDVLVSLLSKYLVEYKGYKQDELDKIAVEYKTPETHDQFNNIVSNLDALIPTILGLVGLKDANGNAVSSLEGLINGYLNDSIADMLVGMITELLAGLPAKTIDDVLGYVRQLTNLTNLDITPKAFANNDFGSQVKAFFEASATKAGVTLDELTWAQVWEFNSVEADDPETTDKVERKFTGFAWGVAGLRDLVNLLCDFVQPLDCVLAVLLQGGQVEADFIANGGTTVGKSISALDEINIMGGMGYNYAIIPLLELLGIDAMSQAAYDAQVAANYGSTLYPVLDQLVTAVEDEILDAPVNWLAKILANLCYVIGNDDVGTIVDNLIAPVNQLIEKVDPIFPIAIDINIGDIGTDNAVVETYLGKAHPGLDAGIHIRVKGTDLATMLTGLLAGIEVNGKKLGIELNLNWLELAAKAGADTDGNGKVDMENTKLDTKYDIYNGGNSYKTIKGDAADTFVTLLEVVLTEKNLEAILGALDVELSPEIKDIIDKVIEDPSSIIDLIAGLLGDVNYQPIQNRPINVTGVDYRNYTFMTEQNADMIAQQIDSLIVQILQKAGLGSLRGLLGQYISGQMVNKLLDMLVGLLAGDSVGPILTTIATLDLGIDLPLTLPAFAAKISELAKTRAYLQGAAAHLNKAVAAGGENATWANVTSFEAAGIDWKFSNGDLYGFVQAVAGMLTPLNDLLELLLIGEGKELDVMGIVQIGGGNGYDYGIIPLLEAFGLTSAQVKNINQYKQAVAEDETQLLGYILNRIAFFADNLLNKPVDTLLTILPNLAYYFSNEGLLLTVKNLLAPVYTILVTVTNVLGVDFEGFLKLEQLLHNIDFGIIILNNKYDFRIPEIDWMRLAQEGGDSTKEVSTSRSVAANSYTKEMRADEYAAYTAANPDAPHKTTQKYIVSDKGDTLTVVFTWVLEAFLEDDHNREALVQWLVDFFDLKAGATETVRYALNQLAVITDAYAIPEIIVAALFQGLGVALVIEKVLMEDIAGVQEILKQLFSDIGDSSTCSYGAIAKVLDDMTGVWYDIVGDDDEHQGAVDNTEETLNWFQRLIKKIKEFFEKIFSIFK